MTAKDYVERLEQVAQDSKGTKEEEPARHVADYARKFFDLTNGQRSGVVFFAIPMMVEVIHQCIADYVKASMTTKLNQTEQEYVRAFRERMADIVFHIDGLIGPDPEQPVEVYRDLNKDDA